MLASASAARSAAGELADRQIASQGSGLLPDDLQLGLDGDGSAVVVWTEKQGTSLLGSLPSTRGAFGRRRSESRADDRNEGTVPRVPARPRRSRNLRLAGRRRRHPRLRYDIGCVRMQTMDRAPDGSLGPIETVSPGGQDAISSRVALAPNGAAAAVWGVGDLSSHPKHRSMCRAPSAPRRARRDPGHPIRALSGCRFCFRGKQKRRLLPQPGGFDIGSSTCRAVERDARRRRRPRVAGSTTLGRQVRQSQRLARA